MSGARLLKSHPPADTSVNYSSAIAEFAIGLSPIEGWVPPFEEEAGDSCTPDISRFLDTVQSRVPGITMALIELEMINVIEEFCYRSLYFRNSVHWQMQQGISQVVINPYDARMVTVYIISQHGLYDFYVDPPATLIDTRPPNAARTGTALIVLKPRRWKDVSTGLMPQLFSLWFETMLDGLLFRLYGMPVRPWSSPQLAQYHGSRFRMGINRARDIAERLNTHAQSPFRTYPYFARGRRKQ